MTMSTCSAIALGVSAALGTACDEGSDAFRIKVSDPKVNAVVQQVSRQAPTHVAETDEANTEVFHVLARWC